MCRHLRPLKSDFGDGKAQRVLGPGRWVFRDTSLLPSGRIPVSTIFHFHLHLPEEDTPVAMNMIPSCNSTISSNRCGASLT